MEHKKELRMAISLRLLHVEENHNHSNILNYNWIKFNVAQKGFSRDGRDGWKESR